MCDDPINIDNPNYGIYPGETKRLLVPCGKCKSCFTARAKAWFVRLHYENRISDSAHFVTLTYDQCRRTFNDLNTLYKPDVQNFMKRLRKRENSNRIKYYLAGEYGHEYQRPHYHLLLFNVRDEKNILRAWSEYELQPTENVSDAYTGAVDIGRVEEASIMYVTGYIGKKIGIPLNDYDDREKEFSLMSKKMGLSFFEKAHRYNLRNEETFTNIEGIKYSLPRYYRDKIWTPKKITPYSGLLKPYVFIYKRKKINAYEMKPIVKNMAQLKPLVKRNPLLTKIIKKNVANQIKNQERDIDNFPTVGDWQVHKFHASEISNQKQQVFINAKI